MNSDAVCVTALLHHTHTVTDKELLHYWPESPNNTGALVAEAFFVVGNDTHGHGNVLEIDTDRHSFNLDMIFLNCWLCYFCLAPGQAFECSQLLSPGVSARLSLLMGTSGMALWMCWTPSRSIISLSVRQRNCGQQSKLLIDSELEKINSIT
ncbi:hypothetical protein AFLA70_292g001351 [Aspergillus flavus AF70]|nr:hypothetical protein AFLA70_292g001351 [Aspergillus flavus AF70]